MSSTLVVLFVVASVVAALPVEVELGQDRVSVVSRASWGARPAKSTSNLSKPLSYIFIHHSAGNEPTNLASGKSTVKGIQNFHMDSRGYSDIGYSFLIGGDGTVFEGRGWNNVGAHTQGYNSNGYGICFMGDFTNKDPSAAAVASAKSLISDAKSRGFIKSNYVLKGHRQMGSTACPGNRLFNIIKSWSNFAN